MYQVSVYTPGQITTVANGVSMERARGIAETYVSVVDDVHVAIIGESGITAEYWKYINGKPQRFDARSNHMAYRDMIAASKS
jgi:hypothetical protein